MHHIIYVLIHDYKLLLLFMSSVVGGTDRFSSIQQNGLLFVRTMKSYIYIF
jgi:hypothetical protein